MSDFSVFMAGHAVRNENVKYVASKRFVDDKKKPVEWELKAVSTALDESIRKDCTKRVPTGNKGQYTKDIDNDKYSCKMAIASTVYPNLNDAALQDSYGVKGAEDLLKAMLLPGEYMSYLAKVMEVNGYDVGMEELVDEAKN